MDGQIGIIGAMSIELEHLKANLKPFAFQDGPTETVSGSLTFYKGMLNDTPVVLVQSGIGKVNAALCAQRLILEFGCTHIINTGIAGAMAHGLKVLDFVVSTDAVYHDMDATGFGYKITEIPQSKCSAFKADEKMIQAIEKAHNEISEFQNHQLVKGRIATGDQFISDKNIKATIAQNCNPACVEMEGAAIAHACYLNNIPFAIVRCMSDMADDVGENTYSFNEEEAANLSAKLVMKTISNL